MTLLVNFVLFQAGWFACVLGAAHGHAVARRRRWPPPSSPIACCGASLRAPELALLLGVSGIGVVVDSALVMTGWIAYPSAR